MSGGDDVLRIVTILSPILLAVVVWRLTTKAIEAAKKAADEAENVRQHLVINTSATMTKLDHITLMVNSRLSEALLKIDRLETRIYNLTGEEPTGEPAMVPTEPKE